ncbi:MAG: AAA family ATPase, partial [Candidatus Binatia bacterium]
MKCLKCQHENPDSKKFCRECGAKLVLRCPKCEAEILPKDQFCGECGHGLRKSTNDPPFDHLKPQSYTPKFLADKILKNRSSIEGERKLVTVLFADIKGSTELIGTTTFRGRLQVAVTRGMTRLVEREDEIKAINQALERAKAGHGQILAVVGEAGVGKSRLVYEFVHSNRTQGWLVLESASVSYGKAIPYFPVVDLLKRYVQVEEGDDSGALQAKVTGQIMNLNEKLQDTIPPLLWLLDALPEDSPFLQLDPF